MLRAHQMYKLSSLLPPLKIDLRIVNRILRRPIKNDYPKCIIIGEGIQKLPILYVTGIVKIRQLIILNFSVSTNYTRASMFVFPRI